MKRQIKIIIPGTPIPKMRARISKFGAYDIQSPQKQGIRNFMWACAHNEKFAPLECPCAIDFKFFMAIPPSMSKAQQNYHAWNLYGHTKKPDFDNLEKFYLDCGSSVLYKDDALVQKCTTEKRYSLTPRVEMTVKATQGTDVDEKTLKTLSKFNPDEYLNLLSDISTLNMEIPRWKKHIEEGDVGEWMTDSFDKLNIILEKYEKILKAIKNG